MTPLKQAEKGWLPILNVPLSLQTCHLVRFSAGFLPTGPSEEGYGPFTRGRCY